jgi:hypothetical protein
MISFLESLKPRQRRGSKPRCHGITHGAPDTVATRLTGLILPYGFVSLTDRWMPEGFSQTDEAELHKASRLLNEAHRTEVRQWWFEIFRGSLQTSPSFDIASTCTVADGKESRPGILLIEAKAHDEELRCEERGKPLKEKPSPGEQTNHRRIGAAIREASESFTKVTGLNWSLSHESRYQMSSRFALAWKLTALGYPVILVYLGFLKADEMADGGKRKPFTTAAEWDALVRSHSASLFPAGVWNQPWALHGQRFVSLIRSVEWPLNPEGSA